MLQLDPVTQAALEAAPTPTGRAQAVLSSISGAITVTVYDGTGAVKGSGTMASLGTLSANVIVLGTSSDFAVSETGTPDPATWTIEFKNAASPVKWMKGTFGLSSSPTAEFKWSLATWTNGQTGTISNSYATVRKNEILTDATDSFNVAQATQNSPPQWAVSTPSSLTLAKGSSYSFTGYAYDADGDVLTYSVSPTYAGISIPNGILTIGSTATEAVRNLTIRITDPSGAYDDHPCTVTIQASTGTILWDGSSADGNFGEWQQQPDKYPGRVGWGAQVPNYGCPPRVNLPAVDDAGAAITYQYRIDPGTGALPPGGPTGELINLVKREAATDPAASIVVGPTRGSSPYAIRFTVKSLYDPSPQRRPDYSKATFTLAENASQDCDVSLWGPKVEVDPVTGVNVNGTGTTTGPPNPVKHRSRLYGSKVSRFNMLPSQQTRWASVSIRLPPASEFTFGKLGRPVADQGRPYKWGPTLVMWAPEDNVLDEILAIRLTGEDTYLNGRPSSTPVSWQFTHIWDTRFNPTSDPHYSQIFRYSGFSPNADGSGEWADVRDFPTDTQYAGLTGAAACRAALANLNQGNWTDFVARIRPDMRTVEQGGQGSIELWMRFGGATYHDASPNPWIKVLNIRPKTMTHPNRGYTGSGTIDGYSYTGGLFRHGIACNLEPGSTATTSLSYSIGMYVATENVVWHRSNMNIHFANMKVGDSACSFNQMSPDGSMP